MVVRRQLRNLLETFNTDLRDAFADGLKPTEAAGLMGAFNENMLKALPKESRKPIWEAIMKGMERRFNDGIFDND